jgi:hypothetical protein
MIKQTIEIDNDIVEFLEDGLRRFPSVLQTAIKRNVSRFRTRILGKLQQEPGSPKYPIKWARATDQSKPPNTRWGYYSKQKAAFFATRGFGRGIPTQRTGKLINSWKIEVDQQSDAGIFQVYNDAQNRDGVYYEQFVTGIYQQAFHHDTGWYKSQDILVDAMVEAEDVIIDTIFAVTDEVLS